MNRFGSSIVVMAAITAPAWPVTSVHADDDGATGRNTQPLPAITVEATAIAGASVDADKIPGNVQSVTANDIRREGAASLTRALDTGLGSVSIGDNLDDPFQPDILYRGFEASPVLGTPQGLAVYQNGVRINEAFGDTVNWDLLPDFAIDRVDIVSSSPVYGLNALGGGISIRMKDGFSDHGGDLQFYGGSFSERAGAIQYGVSSGPYAFYIAGRALNQDGWREFSPDSLRQLYAVFSRHGDRASLDLSYSYADDQLNGQGPAPVQELALDRSLVFTGPQNNDNRLNFVTLNGAYAVADHWSVQSVLYYRQYQQTIANGNTTNFAACTTTPGILCQPDAVTPLTNQAGQALPDISQGGTIPIGQNDFESINAFGRGVALQSNDDQPVAGHGNTLTAGVTFDDAQLDFFSGTQISVINSQLLVLPSQLLVNTPESSPYGPSPVSLKAVNRDFGAYVTDTFNLTAKGSLTASARYNSASIDLRDQLGSELTGNNRFAHLNPALGGALELLPAVIVYGGFSENTRTPTASEIECSDPQRPCLLPSNLAGDPPNLRQVIARTYEVGARSAATHRVLSWNLSLFRTQVHNDIYGIATSISSGYFQNIGATRRQGLEAGFKYRAQRWSSFLSYSFVDATFQSALLLPSPSNPFQDANGNIEVSSGDRLPGIPRHRLKAGVDVDLSPVWAVGAALRIVSDQIYFGDESNQNPPLPGFHVVDVHTSYRVNRHVEAFGSISNLFNSKFSTFGIDGDPTGVGAPGIPAGAMSNGPGVDNRFQSPAAPFALTAGIRVNL
jgi:iron complex outermembrane receptor protein